MSDSQQFTPRILLPTDFGEGSKRAFYHALAFAVSRQARLTLLHTGSESREQVPWNKFPGVRETLTEWGLLEADAPRTAVADKLNLGVAKMAMRDDDPRQGITDYLRKNPTDLLVMATEGRTGLARLFNASIAETVTFLTNSHALLLPKKAESFVSAETGAAKLDRVLCVLDPSIDPTQAVEYLSAWLPAFGGQSVEILVVLNDADMADDFSLPEIAEQSWRHETRPGKLIDAILSAAADFCPQMVVTSTQGPLSLRARMRGSTADKVLRELNLPFLSMPRI